MAPMPPQEMAWVLVAASYWMLVAVMIGSGEGVVTGRSRRWRIFRLPAAWWRCGIVFTRNLLGFGPWDLCRSIQSAGIAGRFRAFTPRSNDTDLGPRLVKA